MVNYTGNLVAVHGFNVNFSHGILLIQGPYPWLTAYFVFIIICKKQNDCHFGMEALENLYNHVCLGHEVILKNIPNNVLYRKLFVFPFFLFRLSGIGETK